MKKIVALIIAFLLSITLVSCGASSGISQEDYDELERRYNRLQEEYEDLQSDYQSLDDAYDDLYDAFAELYFVADDSESSPFIDDDEDTVLRTHYNGYELFSDTDGSKWIRFNFTFQNNGAEPWSLWQLLYIKVFQDGIEIYRDWPSNSDEAIENSDIEIKDGVSLECSFAYPVDGEKIQMYIFEEDVDYQNPEIFEEVIID